MGLSCCPIQSLLVWTTGLVSVNNLGPKLRNRVFNSANRLFVEFSSCGGRYGQLDAHNHEPPSRLYYLWLLLRWDCRLRVFERGSTSEESDVEDIIRASVHNFPLVMPTSMSGFLELLSGRTEEFHHFCKLRSVLTFIESMAAGHSRNVYVMALRYLMSRHYYWYNFEHVIGSFFFIIPNHYYGYFLNNLLFV